MSSNPESNVSPQRGEVSLASQPCSDQDWQTYGQPLPQSQQPCDPRSVPQPCAPAFQMGTLDTNRSLLKYILLGIITFGIYDVWVLARAGEDLNVIASRWDGRRTMNFWLVALVISPLTIGIAMYIWMHQVCGRIGREQNPRGMKSGVTAGDFWLWAVLGGFIIVGPFIFMHKFLHAVNALAADYNVRG
ncbi:DUF4234 domain-containing protein [Cutibacterium acnes]